MAATEFTRSEEGTRGIPKELILHVDFLMACRILPVKTGKDENFDPDQTKPLIDGTTKKKGMLLVSENIIVKSM